MSLPKPLMFTVGLIDQITRPIAKISKNLTGLTENYQAGTMQMATGIGGIAASGYALQNALMPAIEMDKALGEIESLGVRQSGLETLANTSYDYALKYGKSSTEFVRSSYDIQSAIAGLNDADLSQFTLASNVLATATKADAATITNYMGTMYGIFKNDALAMGKGNWVKQVTGMTASAVQAFKTTGAEMSGAFTAIGAEANSAGISMSEQMAVLGTLQATMSGSESGTKYKAFLAGVGKAQKALNLSFVDANGSLLPMVDILNRIKGKFGETFDVAESDALATAFGSSEAVATVKLLMSDIDGLAGSIDDLGKVKGMQQAEIMAASMTDQSERLTQSWYVIRAALGTAVLPAFNDFVSKIADMGKDVLWFANTFPNLTKYLGYSAIALLGVVAAGGAFTVMMGLGKMAMTTYGVAAMAWAGINALLTSGLASLRAVMLALNIAMYANPIGLLVAGIALAITAVSALIYYWDDLVAVMSKWQWLQQLMGWFNQVWINLKNGAIDTINWIINKLNLLPGFEIDVISKVDGIAQPMALPQWMPQQTKAEVINGPWLPEAANDPVSPYTFNHSQNHIAQQRLELVKPNPYAPEPLTQSLNVSRSPIPEYQPSPMAQQLELVKPTPYALEPLTQSLNVNRSPVPEYQPSPMAQQLELVKPAAYSVEPITQQLQVKRDIPAPYSPEVLNQELNIKPSMDESVNQVIHPRFDKQAASRAQASRVANQGHQKTVRFGDVNIHHPPKHFSLAELAEQQELMTG